MANESEPGHSARPRVGKQATPICRVQNKARLLVGNLKRKKEARLLGPDVCGGFWWET